MNHRITHLIVELRRQSGLSQEKLAELADIPLRSYQRIETGEVSPRIEIIFRILRALDTNPTEIFIDLFNKTDSEKNGNSESKITIYSLWSNTQSAEPLLIETAEVEGLKRALSGDYEKGISEVGYWEFAIKSKIFYWSAQMYNIYQMELSEKFDYGDFINRIVPQDLERIELDLQQLIDHDIPYQNDHRVIVNGHRWTVRGTAKKYINTVGEIIVFGIAEKVK